MTILPPKIREEGGCVTAAAGYQCKNGPEGELWFKLESKYQEFVVTERGDAFLVALLLLAMVRGEDIRLECPVSEKLFYHLTQYLIPALPLANPRFRPIKVFASRLEKTSLNRGNAVGTGFSGGIDSFATIYSHLENPNCPESFRLTHLTFFNVGSHGDMGGESARALFQERGKILGAFPAERGLDYLVVDSNISDILQLNYEETYTIRSMAPVLLLQKLFRTYYYSAGYRIDEFKMTAFDMALYDVFNLPMLSTESVQMYSAGCPSSRVDKTRLIADYEPTWRFLNVCACMGKNCSTCFKCLRTLITLEILEKINNYGKVFDLTEYEKHRVKYIAQVLAYRDRYFFKDIFNEMIKSGFPIPLESRVLSWPIAARAALRKILH